MNDDLYLAFPLMRLLGLRIGECLGLSFDDFNQQNHTALIHRSYCVVDERLPDGSWAKRRYQVEEYLKKGAPPRENCVSDEVFSLVQQIREILLKKNIVREQLFEVTTPNNLEMKLYRLCDELEITRRSPHKLRKTYVSMLLNNGFDADFVRKQVGHQQLQTTLNNYAFSTTPDEEIIK